MILFKFNYFLFIIHKPILTIHNYNMYNYLFLSKFITFN